MILPANYDPGFVVASIVIAVWASFVALEVSARMLDARHPLAWAALAAVIWGAGIWGMHFLAMLAFSVPAPFSYDVILTGFSLLLPMIVAFAGFSFANRRKPLGLRNTFAVGAVFGTAVVVMHFIGMEAMVMPSAMMEQTLAFVYASYGIAIAAATAAVWLVFCHPGSVRLRRFAALPLGLAIAAMHYTAMAGLTVFQDGAHQHFTGAPVMQQEGLGLWVALVMSAILTAGGLVASGGKSRS